MRPRRSATGEWIADRSIDHEQGCGVKIGDPEIAQNDWVFERPNGCVGCAYHRGCSWSGIRGRHARSAAGTVIRFYRSVSDL